MRARSLLVTVQAARRLALGTALLLAGCVGSSPPSRFYLLTPLPGPEVSPDATPHVTLVVGPVSLPPEIDRPQLVTRVGSYERRVHETARWAAPLHENVARVLAENLASRLGTPLVSTVPVKAGGAFDRRVAVDILAFDAVPGGECVLTARWTVSDRQGNVGAERRSSVRAPTAAGRPEDIVGAMSRNLADLADEIAALLGGAPAGS
jgi:hypothetical protein